MFKHLPEECLMNISTFLLGKPQYLKLKNSKTLKQIQTKVKPSIEGKGCLIDDDRTGFFEMLWFDVKPKFHRRDYILRLIDRQTETVKNLIKQSHFRYLQPDMETEISLTIKGIVSDVDDEEYPIDVSLLNPIEYTSDEDNNIEEALDDLSNGLDYKLKQIYESETDYKILYIHFYVELFVNFNE